MKKVVAVKMAGTKSMAEQVLERQDKDAMLRRALERIIQLYTDKSHFVYELLQNAEDAGASKIKFLQYEDCLEVLHDGLPFTRENLQGLCDIGLSDKTDDYNQIGEFGVGFKSVFGICETVQLHSQPTKEQIQKGYESFSVEIVDFTHPQAIPNQYFDGEFTTKFVFPYSVDFSFSGFDSIEKLTSALAIRLENLGITTLLFMKSLQRIDYQIDLPNQHSSGTYRLEKEHVNDHCALVSARGMEDKVEEQEEVSFLVFSRPVSTKQMGRTIDIAFSLSVDPEGNYHFKPTKSPYISVYFPTETESKLRFIVQGPYRTTPNRSSVPFDDEDNVFLAKETAKLLRDSVAELHDRKLLDLSFLNLLPVNQSNFVSAPLFENLYEETKAMLGQEEFLPTRSGGYSKAENVKIARGNDFAEVLNDAFLSELLNDGKQYHWLPTVLTETNKEYAELYDFLTDELEIEVLRPEALKEAINANKSFLRQRDDQWLVKWYEMYAGVAAAFSKNGGQKSMLLAEMIKTTTGEFVAPYRRVVEGKTSHFLPTVYLPDEGCEELDYLAFVDEKLLKQCEHFFKDVVGITTPNTYELFINDFKNRRDEGTLYSDEDKAISDLKKLYYYSGFHNYSAEILRLVDQYLDLRCKRCGNIEYVNPAKKKVLFSTSENGMNLELYCKNVISIPFVDESYYQTNGISREMLSWFGVQEDISLGKDKTTDDYKASKWGKTWKWYTRGDFRWELSLEGLSDVLYYISKHPNDADSMAKSSYILRFLLNNEDHLNGTLYISDNTKHHDSYSEIVRVLRNENDSEGTANRWNGKWLFTKDGVLVSQKEVSKYDLNTQLYGEVDPQSCVYEYLAFSKSTEEQYEEAGREYDKLDTDTKNKYFEIELQRRFGLSVRDLESQFDYGGSANEDEEQSGEGLYYEFPTVHVRNWDNLKKHVEEVLSFALPVTYAYKVRSLRISRRDSEIVAYLKSMYKYENSYKCACQMCHNPVPSIEKCQLSKKMDVELDEMYLALCPSCATEYRRLRQDEALESELVDKITSLSQNEIDNSNPVKISVGEEEIWFTQTHIAEICELLKLQKEADSISDNKLVEQQELDEGESAGVDIFQQFVGQRVEHTVYGRGLVKECDGKRIVIEFEEGQKAGETGTYSVQTCWANDLIHVI